MADHQTTKLLIEAAKRTLREQGFSLTRIMSGRGPANRWRLTKDGETQAACIRTTQSRWFAFPPREGGKKWKTLDDVQTVVVATVDNKDRPNKAQIFIFTAAEVRKRFDAAYEVRATERQNFSLSINLDPDWRSSISSAGSGLATAYPPTASYLLSDLSAAIGVGNGDEFIPEPVRDNFGIGLHTVAEVVAFARKHIARIADVAEDAVKLDLKIGN